MARDPRDTSSLNTSNTSDDASHATPDDTDNLLPTHEPGVDERYIPVGFQFNDMICITPESAVGGVLVDSPAGSGTIIYPSFSTAVHDAWGYLEEDYSVDRETPLMGEAVPPELREARRAFTALLDRYEKNGFSADLAKELDKLCCKYTPYHIVQIESVLPDGLEWLLDLAFERLDEDDEEALASAPPRDEFDLHNPEHIAWLQEQLEFLPYQ